jgi:uncharacterized protein YkwD
MASPPLALQGYAAASAEPSTSAGPGPAALTASTPRARLLGSYRVLASGSLRVTVRSNAAKVRVSYRSGTNRARSVIIAIRQGSGAVTLAKGSRSLVAQTLPTARLRASATVALRRADTTAPRRVTGLRVTAQAPTSVILRWTNPTDPDLAVVIVRRATGGTAPSTATSGTGVALATPRATGATERALAPSTTYAYAVFTRDRSGNTSTAAVASVRTPADAGTVVDLQPPEPTDATVAAGSRASVLASMSALAAQERVDPGWTGSVGGCVPGQTSAAFKAAVRDRLNWHRNMVGLPDVPLSAANSARAQAAALMMSAQRALSHSPPPGWACYSATGASAAGQSNLHLGRFGPRAISGYVDDPGAGNRPVGHRRWILFPGLASVGTGDIPGGLDLASNALHVFDHTPTRAEVPFVAWPAAGYIPMSMLPGSRRWSFSLPGAWDRGADFSAATVVVQGPSQVLPVTVVSDEDRGYGDNTVVFEVPPLGLQPSSPDTTFTVTVANVRYRGATVGYRYRVTVLPQA